MIRVLIFENGRRMSFFQSNDDVDNSDDDDDYDYDDDGSGGGGGRGDED